MRALAAASVSAAIVCSRDGDSVVCVHHSLKAQLLSDFEAWFTLVGGDDADADVVEEPDNMDDGDVLDDGEAFDRLEMERVAAEDPDSLAYHNAKKRMQSTLRSTKRGRRR